MPLTVRYIWILELLKCDKSLRMMKLTGINFSKHIKVMFRILSLVYQ